MVRLRRDRVGSRCLAAQKRPIEAAQSSARHQSGSAQIGAAMRTFSLTSSRSLSVMLSIEVPDGRSGLRPRRPSAAPSRRSARRPGRGLPQGSARWPPGSAGPQILLQRLMRGGRALAQDGMGLLRNVLDLHAGHDAIMALLAPNCNRSFIGYLLNRRAARPRSRSRYEHVTICRRGSCRQAA